MRAEVADRSGELASRLVNRHRRRHPTRPWSAGQVRISLGGREIFAAPATGSPAFSRSWTAGGNVRPTRPDGSRPAYRGSAWMPPTIENTIPERDRRASVSPCTSTRAGQPGPGDRRQGPHARPAAAALGPACCTRTALPTRCRRPGSAIASRRRAARSASSADPPGTTSSGHDRPRPDQAHTVPTDAALLVDGIAAAQEALVDPEIGLQCVRPAL